ncbi:MAG TPA: arsenate reductase ArsC [Nitrospira sp.]|nr:arsenate reductase ArsC [Nitrospira sp.]
MAEGWLRHLAGDRFEVFSAGTHPVGLNPGSVDAMAEVGIDISAHRSKQVSEFLTQPFDHVITVCDRAKESCPRWPGSTHLLHWSFDDPAAATDSDATRLQLFRRVRDEILGQIKGFLDQEGQPLAAGPR